jgi:hypothetical protein
LKIWQKLKITLKYCTMNGDELFFKEKIESPPVQVN